MAIGAYTMAILTAEEAWSFWLSLLIACGLGVLAGREDRVALYRRIAHWLMKEPDLEEEALPQVRDVVDVFLVAPEVRHRCGGGRRPHPASTR